MRHRATAASSLRTRTAALPGSWKRSSESRLPKLVVAAFVLLAPSACSSAGEDAPFPNRPIEIVSWATPGGPSDLLSRMLADVAPAHFDG